MAEEMEMVWVCSAQDHDRVHFYERNEAHPNGVAMVAGKTPVKVALTGAVAKSLRDPDGIQKVSDAERAQWAAEREQRREGAVSEAMEAGMASPGVVSQMQNEIAELRAQLGRLEKSGKKSEKE